MYRAVHLELATSLSVDGFTECLRRFISRRGRPTDFYISDSGTNFVGTRNVFNEADWEKIRKYTAVLRNEWHLNPPSAPWWGGWWERLVVVLKVLLQKGRASLPYEELNTILCEAEAIINSRPLTYVSEDPDDLAPLSPSSFLQENVTVGLPEFNMINHSELNKKLRYRKKILEDLKQRFRTEYLGSLLTKERKQEKRTVSDRYEMLIGDDNHKRLDWVLARVIQQIPGRDGKSRVFILKTKNGTLTRPLQRLYPLEVGVESTDIANDLSEKAVKNNNLKKCIDNDKSVYAKNMQLNESKNKKPAICEESLPIVTRSGRIVKKPDRYQVCIM